MNKKLKYLGYSIVFQEVPDEVTLAINISGCPHKCEGCHSKYLWEYEGNYISDDLDNLIEKYRGLITCVCFMGGDQNLGDLLRCIYQVKDKNLKVAIYTGLDNVMLLSSAIITKSDYIKYGHYNANLGGLDNPKTNQKMIKFNRETSQWEDITYKFWSNKMAKYKIVLSDDKALIAEVNRQLQETKGYCPCAIEWNDDTKCICSVFREALARGEETECHCGKYKIIKIED